MAMITKSSASKLIRFVRYKYLGAFFVGIHILIAVGLENEAMASNVKVDKLTIDSSGNCNIIIGVNKSTLPTRLECVQFFLGAIKDQAALTKLELDKPFTGLLFSIIQYDGRTNVSPRQSEISLPLGATLISKNSSVDFDVSVKLYRAFNLRFVVNDYKLDEFDENRFRSAEEAWRGTWSPLVRIKKQVLIPGNQPDIEYFHQDGCNLTFAQLQLVKSHLNGTSSDRAPKELQGFPCNYAPHNESGDWFSEVLSPIRANGFYFESGMNTSEVIEGISRGRLSAEINYRNITKEAFFDLKNIFEFTDFVFRFRQANDNAKCRSVLKVHLFPKFSHSTHAGVARLDLSEIDEMVYEGCEANPF